LDDSKVAEDPRFKGLEIELHRYSGARVLRVVHPGPQRIEEHRHDWAYVGIYTLGRYREFYDGGEAQMRGPCAVLHPAGRPHSDLVGDEGLETLTIEFDPAWLRQYGFEQRLDASRIWQGGAVALAATCLARILTDPAADEKRIGVATSTFLAHAFRSEEALPPAWLPKAGEALEAGADTAEISRGLDLHPAWLAHAYRQAVGEGLQETARRLRVERASGFLRRSDLPLADVAVASGFCDQSHMNRCFRAVLGRTPAEVRCEKLAARA
jgi:AraC family transcriptional regulator